MALITCQECKKEISDQALACPQCGFPRVAPKKEKPKKKVSVFVLLVVFALGLFYWYEIRPLQIRKHCYEAAVEAAIGEYNRDTGEDQDQLFYPEDKDKYYKQCLSVNGME